MVFMSCRVSQSLKVSYRPMTTSRTSLNRPAIAAVGRLFDSKCLFCLLQGYVRSSCALRFSFLQFVGQALEQFQRVVTLEAARGSEVGRSLRKTYIESSDMFTGYI